MRGKIFFCMDPTRVVLVKLRNPTGVLPEKKLGPK
jgi:hypothetical protein